MRVVFHLKEQYWKSTLHCCSEQCCRWNAAVYRHGSREGICWSW